jgi:hypothetical protein
MRGRDNVAAGHDRHGLRALDLFQELGNLLRPKLTGAHNVPLNGGDGCLIRMGDEQLLPITCIAVLDRQG